MGAPVGAMAVGRDARSALLASRQLRLIYFRGIAVLVREENLEYAGKVDVPALCGGGSDRANNAETYKG